MHGLARARLAGDAPDSLILLEHPPVFTAGRRARPDELLWSADVLAARGAEVHSIDRGGAFTFHGPGQLVGYPIVDLGARPDAGAHLRRIESSIVEAARTIGVDLQTRPDIQTGVWSGNDKVCAIGIRLLRARVSLHGFGLNCDPDLSWFEGIVACGLPDNGVASLSSLSGRDVTVAEMKPRVLEALREAFGLDPVQRPWPAAVPAQV